MNSYGVEPNFVGVWVTLLLRIREVSGSDLGLETGYTGFSWFYPVCPGKFRVNTLN
jgi:hypothetical protein